MHRLLCVSMASNFATRRRCFAVCIAMAPFLTGAGHGCSAGGDVPVGSGDAPNTAKGGSAGTGGGGAGVGGGAAGFGGASTGGGGAGVGGGGAGVGGASTGVGGAAGTLDLDAASKTCLPTDCTNIAKPHHVNVCTDGTTVGPDLCVVLADGTCGWGYSACPVTTSDAGDSNLTYPEAPTYCTATECAKFPRNADAHTCADGTTVGRTECRRGPTDGCEWQFPACPQPVQPDGGKTVCTGPLETVRETWERCPDSYCKALAWASSCSSFTAVGRKVRSCGVREVAIDLLAHGISCYYAAPSGNENDTPLVGAWAFDDVPSFCNGTATNIHGGNTSCIAPTILYDFGSCLDRPDVADASNTGDGGASGDGFDGC